MIKKYLEVPGTNEDQMTNEGINTTTNTEGEAATTSNMLQDVPFTAHHPPERNEETNIAPEEAIRELQVESSQTIIEQNQHQFVRIRDQMVSRLELEATRNVMLNVALLLLFALTWITSVALTIICQAYTIDKDMNEEQKSKAVVEKCSPYHWAVSYTRLILLIAHSIYQSICYVIRSKECFTEPNQAYIWRCNECTKEPATTRRHHPQRMKNICMPKFNKQPRARLGFEHPQRNGEVNENARQ